MPESPTLIDRLRRVAATGAPSQADPRPVAAWLSEGLARGQLHDLYAADAADGTSAAGFAIALALMARALPVLWLRIEDVERDGGRLHATGLVELGLLADDLLLACVADETALLRAAADAARCSGLGTVMIESRGRAPGLDLTATRRLLLAAEGSGVTVFSLRIGAAPGASAAATRWGIAALPSTALAAEAPGHPAFDIELLRRRGGPAGQRWRVEWNRDDTCFVPQAAAAPLSGARLPLAAGRAVARHPPASVRRAR